MNMILIQGAAVSSFTTMKFKLYFHDLGRTYPPLGAFSLQVFTCRVQDQPVEDTLTVHACMQGQSRLVAAGRLRKDSPHFESHIFSDCSEKLKVAKSDAYRLSTWLSVLLSYHCMPRRVLWLAGVQLVMQCDRSFILYSSPTE